MSGIDNSIACRTILFNINKNKWSKFALNLFESQNLAYPIVPVKHNYGTIFNSNIELKVVIGDQKAAFIGNNGLQQNILAANYGTSASIQLNVGPSPKIIKWPHIHLKKKCLWLKLILAIVYFIIEKK